MAGEREGETGGPAAAGRFTPGSTPAGRGGLAALVGRGELVEPRPAGREAVVTAVVAVEHVVEVVDLRRLRGRLDRGEAGVPDRRRREARVDPRVVGRGGLELGFGDVA